MSEPDAPQETSVPQAPKFRTYAGDVSLLTGKPLPKNIRYEVPPPPPRPTPAPVIPKAPSTNETRESVLKRFETPPISLPKEHPLPAPRISPAPASLPETAPVGIPPLTKPVAGALHTYTSDFREHAASTGTSRIGMVAAEQDRGGGAPLVVRPKKRSGVLLILSGVILVVAGIGSVYGAYRFATGEPPIPDEVFVPTLVFPDERIQISGSAEELRQSLVSATGDSLRDRGVAVVYMVYSTSTEAGVVEKIATGKELFAALRLPAPDILSRNVEPPSTLGVTKLGEEARAFFILRVSSFDRTYKGMLDWEATMERDLWLFYPPHTSGASTTAFSTPQNAPFRLSFIDEIVDNRDVRVLRDSKNRAIMLYGYYDKETLIIARNPEAFSLLLQRISSTRSR